MSSVISPKRYTSLYGSKKSDYFRLNGIFNNYEECKKRSVKKSLEGYYSLILKNDVMFEEIKPIKV